MLFNNAINDTSKIKDLCIGSYCGITALMNSGDGPTNGFAYYFGVKEKVPHVCKIVSRFLFGYKTGRRVTNFVGLSARKASVKIEHQTAAEKVFSTLMGDVVDPRREFIQSNALKVVNLDA